MIERNFKRRLVSDINVIPYVDVMLVLLVIFMVTAPLLTQGVEVDLPNAKTESLPENQKPPIVISVDEKGQLFLNESRTPIETNELAIKVKASLRLDPSRLVLVRGDKQVNYGAVIQAMAVLKAAGVAKVGLMTQHFEVQSN